MKRKTMIISGVVLAVLAVGGSAGISRIQASPVALVAVRSDEPGRIYGLGTIEARVLSRVAFEVTGTVAAVAVDQGDSAAAGRELARLDTRRQQARLDQANAERARAKATLEQAASQLERSRALLAQRQSADRRKQSLVRSGTVAVEAAEDARTELKVAETDVNVAEKNRQVASSGVLAADAAASAERVLLDLHVIAAPYPALVVERLAEPGQVVVAGQPVLTLVDPASVWAELHVDEAAAGGLAVGMPVELTLRSRPGESLAGRIARIGVEADRIGGERRVYATFDSIPEHFTLGEQVEGLILIAGRDLVTLPRTAVSTRDGQTGVWLVDDGRVQWRQVSLGRQFADGRSEVVSGLAPGIRIVQQPQIDLVDGSRIRVAEVRP